MEATETQSNYQKHLYFEQRPESREYRLDKCIKILALIAQLNDRNQAIRDYCEEFHGRSELGLLLAPQREHDRYNKNLGTIKRLKQYYNSCLEAASKTDFKI